MYQQAQSFSMTVCLLVGMAVLGVLPSGAYGQDGLDLRHRFLTEAPRQWEEYLQFARRLQVSIPSKSGSRVEYKQTDGAALRISENEVEGSNPSYSFTLKRSSPEQGWYLVDFQMANGPANPDDTEETVQERVLRDICNCLKLWNLWLPSLIQDPDFKIKSVQLYPQEKGEWVRVEFEYPKEWNDYPVKGGWRITSGWMALDPAHDWILREYAVNYKSTISDREQALAYKKFYIKEGTDRHPIVTGSTSRIMGKDRNGQPFERVGEAEWHVVEETDRPIEEFTLSAFGLREPVGVTWEKPIPTYVWVLVAAGACAVLAFGFRYLARRRQAAALTEVEK